MYKLSEEMPEDCSEGESFSTLALMYSDDPDIEDQQSVESDIVKALEKRFPEFGENA